MISNEPYRTYNRPMLTKSIMADLDEEQIAVQNAGWYEEQNIQQVLDGRKPDYLIVQHMEPDHAANVANFLKVYPDTTVVATGKAFGMIRNFFELDLEGKKIEAENGSTLSLGYHHLTFVFAPMVHWPEVMVTYDSTEKVLFSADGFGKFGALDVEEPWDDEARRYFIGIVGKYGEQVQKLLKAAATLDIQKICPLHGPVLTEDLGHYIGLYDTWSSYTPEEEGIYLATLDLSMLRSYREEERPGAWRHPEKYGILTDTEIAYPFCP